VTEHPGRTRGARPGLRDQETSQETPRLAADRHTSMTRNSQKRRTPEEIRAGNLRLGLILLAVVAFFFVSAVIKQVYFSAH
jgi:hypothetical protein